MLSEESFPVSSLIFSFFFSAIRLGFPGFVQSLKII
jgi:hypothetical protein